LDGSRFDAWTRRRLTLATGGLLASLAPLGILDEAAAKKKKRKKKRCRKLGAACTPGAKRKCCDSFTCSTINLEPGTQTRCCKYTLQACVDDLECCQGLGCINGICQTPLVSDRALKANFGSVEPADMLARVRELPISTWNYTSDDPAIRHIGPMAQDFAATFGVGVDDRHIHPLDGQGVALAAIQGLIAELDALREENARLAARVAALEGDR
jgi:hypothetical protein